MRRIIGSSFAWFMVGSVVVAGCSSKGNSPLDLDGGTGAGGTTGTAVTATGTGTTGTGTGTVTGGDTTTSGGTTGTGTGGAGGRGTTTTTTGTGGSGTGGAGGSGGGANCAQVCEKVLALKCPNDEGDCSICDASPPQCKAQFDVAIACLATTTWSCDSDGQATPAGCVNELTAWVLCASPSGFAPPSE